MTGRTERGRILWSLMSLHKMVSGQQSAKSGDPQICAQQSWPSLIQTCCATLWGVSCNSHSLQLSPRCRASLRYPIHAQISKKLLRESWAPSYPMPFKAAKDCQLFAWNFHCFNWGQLSLRIMDSHIAKLPICLWATTTALQGAAWLVCLSSTWNWNYCLIY